MPQVQFVGGPDACAVFGREFAPGEWVEVSSLHPAFVAALSTNPTFQFQADPRPTRGPKTRPDPAPSMAADGKDAQA